MMMMMMMMIIMLDFSCMRKCVCVCVCAFDATQLIKRVRVRGTEAKICCARSYYPSAVVMRGI